MISFGYDSLNIVFVNVPIKWPKWRTLRIQTVIDDAAQLLQAASNSIFSGKNFMINKIGQES